MNAPTRLATLSAATLVLASACSAPSEALDDTLVVYCLSPDNTQRLIEAGLALGMGQISISPNHLAIDGIDVSVKEWQTGYPNDFARACRALRQSSVPQQPASASPTASLWSVAILAITAFLGGFATYMFGAIRIRNDRRREDSSELRAAAKVFTAQIDACVRHWRQPTVLNQPDTADFFEARIGLLTEIGKLKKLYPRWQSITQLESRVCDFDEIYSAQKWGNTIETRRARALQVETAVAELQSSTAIMARAIELGIVARLRNRTLS